ncbi:tetraspanin-5-like [Cydia strobilella]|uniref:tetraspanin-5-like n=1 Tax=Cydia strobilella TaxID=1100964 RepID=UPI0030073BA6
MACKHTSKKIILMIVNVIVMLVGLGVFGVGLCWYMRVNVISNIFGYTSKWMAVALMLAGPLAAAAGILGCYGAITQKVLILIIFKVLLIVLLGAKVACVLLVFIKKEWFAKSGPKNEPEKFQMIFTAFMAAMAAAEITATVFAYNLIRHVRTCPQENEN